MQQQVRGGIAPEAPTYGVRLRKEIWASPMVRRGDGTERIAMISERPDFWRVALRDYRASDSRVLIEVRHDTTEIADAKAMVDRMEREFPNADLFSAI